MGASSVSVPLPDSGDSWSVDVPMRSFQGGVSCNLHANIPSMTWNLGYYPQLIALYKSLGVAFRKADFSYSFSFLTPPTKDHGRKITATMIYNGGSGRAGVSMPSILNSQQSKNQSFLPSLLHKSWSTGLFVILTAQLLLCYVMTLFYSLPFWRSSKLSAMKFGDWAKNVAPNGMLAKWTGMDIAWQDYFQTVLLPLFSAVCTAPEMDIFNHPAEEFLGAYHSFLCVVAHLIFLADYIWLTFGTHHYVVVNGVWDVVSRLTANLSHIHLSSPIIGIRPDVQDPRLASIDYADVDETHTLDGFHHVIFATQANSAIPLLSEYAASLPGKARQQRNVLENLKKCLESFTYRSTVVINHSDERFLPDDARDRRDLNLVCGDWVESEESLIEGERHTSKLCVSPSYTMATHILPRPKGYPSHLPSVYQTTNPIIPPKKESLLSVASLERAVLTIEGKVALARLSKQEKRRWWQCGVEAESQLGELQGGGRRKDQKIPGIWICGSFAHAGIPLLEGCVISARNVVEQGILQSEGASKLSRLW